jgi:hypothetical protein
LNKTFDSNIIRRNTADGNYAHTPPTTTALANGFILSTQPGLNKSGFVPNNQPDAIDVVVNQAMYVPTTDSGARWTDDSTLYDHMIAATWNYKALARAYQ